MSLNAEITEVFTTPYTANPNTFTYYIIPSNANPLPDTSFTFILPILSEQLSPITIINLNTASVIIKSDTLVNLDTITQNQNATFISNILEFNWQEINSGTTTSSTAASAIGGPII